MKQLLILGSLVLSTTVAIAQQSFRIGAVAAATNIKMNNTDDSKATNLVILPTYAGQYGLEVGYNWRFVGVGMQLLNWRGGQNYTYLGRAAHTKLNYVKPSVMVSFNSNPKNPVRFCGSIGGYYAALTNYEEVSTTYNYASEGLEYATFKNKTFTYQDTGIISGTLNDGIYYSSDAGLFGSLGAEFRMDTRWLLGLTMRADFGAEKLENYDKIKQRYTIGNTSYSGDYEHWRYRSSKYNYDVFHNGVRNSSTNSSLGVFVSLKYLIMSSQVHDYERYGY